MRIDFNASTRTSLGVEWELQLVDRDSRQLASKSDEILHDLSPDGEHPKAKHELLQSCIEVITGVCHTVREATADLRDTVHEVASRAEKYNVGLMCAGTHPLSDWGEQRVTGTERYQALMDRNQIVARQMQIFGVHVHCGVRAAQKAMPIVTALSAYVPHFLALSASSPFWLGQDTGLASYRTKVFEALPTAGLPYQLDGWAGFESYVDALISSRAIKTMREIWWDIRPHAGFGTVELRICDGLPTLDEIGCVAALAQCLVERFDRQLDDGYTLPQPAPWIVRENKWRACRYGLDAEIVLDANGTTAPVREAVEQLVDDLLPVAKRLDCVEEIANIAELMKLGASYQRQRQAAENGIGAVVDLLLAEMKQGLWS